MRPRFGVMLSILPVLLSPQSGNPAPAGTEIDVPERLQMLVREATCAEAPATSSDKLDGTSLSGLLSGGTGTRTIFYVSPDGKDTWSGLLATASEQGDDGPFASIERARDAARERGGSNTIALGKGDYYLTQPIVFDARDAGLILTARCNEAPILHGGLRVVDWARQPDGRWTAPLKLPGVTAWVTSSSTGYAKHGRVSPTPPLTAIHARGGCLPPSASLPSPRGRQTRAFVSMPAIFRRWTIQVAWS